jgi:hypothetical protein
VNVALVTELAQREDSRKLAGAQYKMNGGEANFQLRE